MSPGMTFRRWSTILRSAKPPAFQGQAAGEGNRNRRRRDGGARCRTTRRYFHLGRAARFGQSGERRTFCEPGAGNRDGQRRAEGARPERGSRIGRAGPRPCRSTGQCRGEGAETCLKTGTALRSVKAGSGAGRGRCGPPRSLEWMAAQRMVDPSWPEIDCTGHCIRRDTKNGT